MDRVTVAITGINAVDNPGPGVGVARSLKEDSGLDARIVGLAYDAMEPGVYMDWVIDAAYMMPYPSGGFEAYFQRLSYIADREGVDVVIPTLDTELPLFIRHADRIQAAGLRTFLPSDRQYRLRGKDRLSEVARSMNIALPKTEVVSSYDELSQAVDQIGLPVMIKGAYYKARRAYTLQEAASAYSAIVAE